MRKTCVLDELVTQYLGPLGWVPPRPEPRSPRVVQRKLYYRPVRYQRRVGMKVSAIERRHSYIISEMLDTKQICE